MDDNSASSFRFPVHDLFVDYLQREELSTRFMGRVVVNERDAMYIRQNNKTGAEEKVNTGILVLRDSRALQLAWRDATEGTTANVTVNLQVLIDQ